MVELTVQHVVWTEVKPVSSAQLRRCLNADTFTQPDLYHRAAPMQVLDAMPSLLALRRLRSLILAHIKGLSTLPQLHPLLQLRKLCHLSLQDCPISKLVLLRPYLTFR